MNDGNCSRNDVNNRISTVLAVTYWLSDMWFIAAWHGSAALPGARSGHPHEHDQWSLDVVELYTSGCDYCVRTTAAAEAAAHGGRCPMYTGLRRHAAAVTGCHSPSWSDAKQYWISCATRNGSCPSHCFCQTIYHTHGHRLQLCSDADTDQCHPTHTLHTSHWLSNCLYLCCMQRGRGHNKSYSVWW